MRKLVYLCLGITLIVSQIGCRSGAGGATNANAPNAANVNSPNAPQVNPDPGSTANVNGPAGGPLAQDSVKGKPPLSTTTGISQPPADSNGLSFASMDFHGALLRGHKEQLAALMADDFKGTLQDGTVQTKAQVLAAAQTSDQMFSANVLPPKVTGNSATLTGSMTLMGSDPKTAKPGDTIKFSDTWQKRGAKWLITSTTITK